MSGPEDRIRALIADGGPISFSTFMEEALYGQGGYYATGESRIGREGDFVTGSSVSPLFAAATVRLLERLDMQLRETAQVYEVGYGDATHLRSLASSRPAESVVGWDQAGGPVPDDVRVAPPESLKEGGINGLVFSYELFDALPIHRLVGRPGGELGELAVGLSPEGNWEWVEGDLTEPWLESLLGGSRLQPGQVADLAPGWVPLYTKLAGRLGQGVIVTFDYGFARERLLDPRVRSAGTLACYRQHKVHRNPFVEIAGQDLTAHVDFTALRLAGESLGLETLAFSRQARYLTALGIFDGLGDASQETRQEAMRLLDGGGMGDEIRVLVQGRGVDPASMFDLEILGAAE